MKIIAPAIQKMISGIIQGSLSNCSMRGKNLHVKGFPAQATVNFFKMKKNARKDFF